MPTSATETIIINGTDATVTVTSGARAMSEHLELNRYLDEIREIYRTGKKYKITLAKEKKKSNLPDWF